MGNPSLQDESGRTRYELCVSTFLWVAHVTGPERFADVEPKILTMTQKSGWNSEFIRVNVPRQKRRRRKESPEVPGEQIVSVTFEPLQAIQCHLYTSLTYGQLVSAVEHAANHILSPYGSAFVNMHLVYLHNRSLSLPILHASGRFIRNLSVAASEGRMSSPLVKNTFETVRKANPAPK